MGGFAWSGDILCESTATWRKPPIRLILFLLCRLTLNSRSLRTPSAALQFPTNSQFLPDAACVSSFSSWPSSRPSLRRALVSRVRGGMCESPILSIALLRHPLRGCFRILSRRRRALAPFALPQKRRGTSQQRAPRREKGGTGPWRRESALAKQSLCLSRRRGERDESVFFSFGSCRLSLSYSWTLLHFFCPGALPVSAGLLLSQRLLAESRGKKLIPNFQPRKKKKLQ